MKRKSAKIKSKLLVFIISFCLLGATVYALTYRPHLERALQDPGPQAVPSTGTRAQSGLKAAEDLLSWGKITITPQEGDTESSGERDQQKRTSAASGGSRGTPRDLLSSPQEKSDQIVASPVSAAEQEDRPVPQLRGDKAVSGSGVMARFAVAPQDSDLEQTPAATLPEMPNRGEVAQVMNSIRQLVQRCYDTSMVPGQVDLTLTVEGRTGRVVQTKVSEPSSTAICIRRLARTLRFPKFSRDQITIQHPYTFR